MLCTRRRRWGAVLGLMLCCLAGCGPQLGTGGTQETTRSRPTAVGTSGKTDTGKTDTGSGTEKTHVPG